MMIAVAGVDGERLEKPHVDGLHKVDKPSLSLELAILDADAEVALIRF